MVIVLLYLQVPASSFTHRKQRKQMAKLPGRTVTFDVRRVVPRRNETETGVVSKLSTDSFTINVLLNV